MFNKECNIHNIIIIIILFSSIELFSLIRQRRREIINAVRKWKIERLKITPDGLTAAQASSPPRVEHIHNIVRKFSHAYLTAAATAERTLTAGDDVIF